jgi:hypothetical protein
VPLSCPQRGQLESEQAVSCSGDRHGHHFTWNVMLHDTSPADKIGYSWMRRRTLSLGLYTPLPSPPQHSLMTDTCGSCHERVSIFSAAVSLCKQPYVGRLRARQAKRDLRFFWHAVDTHQRFGRPHCIHLQCRRPWFSSSVLIYESIYLLR